MYTIPICRDVSFRKTLHYPALLEVELFYPRAFSRVTEVPLSSSTKTLIFNLGDGECLPGNGKLCSLTSQIVRIHELFWKTEAHFTVTMNF